MKKELISSAYIAKSARQQRLIVSGQIPQFISSIGHI